MLPWLEQLFDAWDERRRQREYEAAERAALEAAVQDTGDADAFDDDSEEASEDDHKKKKKKKKHGHKD